MGLTGIAFGVVVIVAAVRGYQQPSQHIPWGVVVLIFSIVSIISSGGFILGLVFGVIGGSLGMAWRPGMAWTGGTDMDGYGVPVTPWRMCTGCGRWIPWAYNVCPLCGTQAPVAPWVPRPVPPMAPVGPPAAPGSTPPSAPQQPPAIRAPCPTCGGDAEWLPLYKRWYCPAEARYF